MNEMKPMAHFSASNIQSPPQRTSSGEHQVQGFFPFAAMTRPLRSCDKNRDQAFEYPQRKLGDFSVQPTLSATGTSLNTPQRELGDGSNPAYRLESCTTVPLTGRTLIPPPLDHPRTRLL